MYFFGLPDSARNAQNADLQVSISQVGNVEIHNHRFGQFLPFWSLVSVKVGDFWWDGSEISFGKLEMGSRCRFGKHLLHQGLNLS